MTKDIDIFLNYTLIYYKITRESTLFTPTFCCFSSCWWESLIDLSMAWWQVTCRVLCPSLTLVSDTHVTEWTKWCSGNSSSERAHSQCDVTSSPGQIYLNEGRSPPCWRRTFVVARPDSCVICPKTPPIVSFFSLVFQYWNFIADTSHWVTNNYSL